MMSHHSHDHHEEGPHSHDKHAGHDPAIFRRKFWVCLLLTMPAVAYSHMLQDLLGYTAPMIPGHEWIAPLFGTAVFLYGGLVFLKGGWQEIQSRQPGMMLLISMGLLVAFTASLATTLRVLHVVIGRRLVVDQLGD